jgi:hypothetical protein
MMHFECDANQGNAHICEKTNFKVVTLYRIKLRCISCQERHWTEHSTARQVQLKSDLELVKHKASERDRYGMSIRRLREDRKFLGWEKRTRTQEVGDWDIALEFITMHAAVALALLICKEKEDEKGVWQHSDRLDRMERTIPKHVEILSVEADEDIDLAEWVPTREMDTSHTAETEANKAAMLVIEAVDPDGLKAGDNRQDAEQVSDDSSVADTFEDSVTKGAVVTMSLMDQEIDDGNTEKCGVDESPPTLPTWQEKGKWKAGGAVRSDEETGMFACQNDKPKASQKSDEGPAELGCYLNETESPTFIPQKRKKHQPSDSDPMVLAGSSELTESTSYPYLHLRGHRKPGEKPWHEGGGTEDIGVLSPAVTEAKRKRPKKESRTDRPLYGPGSIPEPSRSKAQIPVYDELPPLPVADYRTSHLSSRALSEKLQSLSAATLSRLHASSNPESPSLSPQESTSLGFQDYEVSDCISAAFSPKETHWRDLPETVGHDEEGETSRYRSPDGEVMPASEYLQQLKKRHRC